MNAFISTVAFIACVAGIGTANGAELTHQFVNPSFGGNPINGSYLLSNATAQNSHKAHPKPSTTANSTSTNKTSTGQQFSEQLDRLVMTALANRLVNKAFGVDSLSLPDSSTIDTGLNTVTVEDTGSGTRVTIVDNKTGGKSVITIPNY